MGFVTGAINCSHQSCPMNDSTRLLFHRNCDSLMDLLGRSQIDM